MSNPAQVEADALLARRLQEEEYMAAGGGRMDEIFGTPPSSQPSRPPDVNQSANPYVGPRRSGTTEGRNTRGGIDPVANTMFNQFMNGLYETAPGGNRNGLRENIMLGLESFMGFQNPPQYSAQADTGLSPDPPRPRHSLPNPRNSVDGTRTTYRNYPYMRNDLPQNQNAPFSSRQQPSGPNSNSDSRNPDAATGAHRSERSDGLGSTGQPMWSPELSFQDLLQFSFGGRPPARNGGPNDGGNNRNVNDNMRGGGMFFGVGGGGPFARGGATFFSGSTATAGPRGATATAQTGPFPGGTNERMFSFDNPEDFMNFLRESIFSGNGGGGDGFADLLRSSVFGNGPVPETYEDFLNLVEQMGTVNRSATNEEIDSLPSHHYSKKSSAAKHSTAGPSASTSNTMDDDTDQQDDKCAICLGDYEPDEEVKDMPCAHQFHSECLNRWLKINRTCPICKQSLRQGDGPTE